MPYPFVLFNQLGGGNASSSPSYPATLLDLRNQVKNMLDLPQDTPRANFNAGTGSGTVLTTDQVINGFLNDGYAEVCRRCFLVYGERTIANVAASTRVVEFVDRTQSTGARMWCAQGAQWQGVALGKRSFTGLQRWHPDWQTATGIPTIWYEQGLSSIGLYKLPSGVGTLFLVGYVIPALLATDAATSVLPPDMNNLIVWYAAGKVAEKAWAAPSLQSRAAIWLGEYENGVQSALWGLWQDDPEFAKRFLEQPQPKVQGPPVPGGVLVATGAVPGQQQGGA